MEHTNLVILMAGGLGTRLRPLTDNTPKALLPVRGRPVLQSIVESFIACGFRRFVLSVGYRGDMIRDHFGDGSKWGASIDYVWDTVAMGTAGSLGLIPPPKEPAFVMNGDVLADVDFATMLRFHENAGRLATVAVHENVTVSPYGVLDIAGSRVRAIREKPSRRDFVSAGIYILEPGAWDLIPQGYPADMPWLLDQLIGGKGVSAFPVWGEWIDIGRLEDLKRADAGFARAAE